MKNTYTQVKDEQVQLRGEIYALTTKIESKVDDITKELEQGRNVTATPRVFDNFPDLSAIGVVTPPKGGVGETHVHTSTGKHQNTKKISENVVTDTRSSFFSTSGYSKSTFNRPRW